MATNKTKKQHTVPEFYLKNFSNDYGKLFAYDKITGKDFPTNTEDVTTRKYFYDYTPIDALLGDQTLEKALSVFEDACARTLKEVIEDLEGGKFNGISIRQRMILAEFIHIQLTRTPEFRIISEQMSQEIERQLLSKGVDKEFIEKSGLKADEYDSKEQQIYNLISPTEEWVHDLCNRTWFFCENKTKYKLYTSDHPVSTHHDHEKGEHEIVFPLSPCYILSIVLEIKDKKLEYADNRLLTLKPENVEFCNHLALLKSHRQIYTCDGDFSFAKKIIKKNPNLSDPDRPRIQGGP